VLLIATFLTIHFGQWRQSWHGMPRRAQTDAQFLQAVEEENEGVIAAIDGKTGEIICSRVFDTPAGFAVNASNIFVVSMYGNRVFVLDQSLEVVDVFADRSMNDLHGVTLSDAGLLIASSGTDALIEVSLSGAKLWDWLGSEHGFDSTPSGHRVWFSRNADYRRSTISTTMQATHCNSALTHRRSGRDVVLATLFHQGKLVSIDRATGNVDTLVSGMRNPHSIRRHGDGWLVADSRSSAVVVLDADFWIESLIESDFNWVQDAVSVGQDAILVADANNSRIVFWDMALKKAVQQVTYPSEWKIYQVELADERWEKAFRSLSMNGASEWISGRCDGAADGGEG
jgi:hypothetical protein